MAENRSSNVIKLPRQRRTRLWVATLRRRSRRDAGGSGLSPASAISDYDLHAFVDNALDGARRAQVQAFLLRHPAAATDAAAYFRQNRMLRALKRPPTPTSPALGYLATQFAFRLTRARIGRAAACSVAAAAIAVVAWWLVLGGWAIVLHLILTAGR